MNRRDFFKTSAIAAAAMSISAVPASASIKPPPPPPLRESLDEVLELDRLPDERSFMWEQSHIYEQGDIVGHDSSVYVLLSQKNDNQKLPPSENLEGWQRI